MTGASVDHATLLRQANALAAGRDWTGAAASFQALARSCPDDAGAWIGLAKAQGLAGHHRAAHAAALSAAAAGPANWPHALTLGRILCNLHEVPLLVAMAQSLLAREAEASPAQMVELADLLGHEDAHADALPWLDLAIAREPDYAPAYYVRGTTRLFFGDMAGARDDLERAIALAPQFAHAHYRLSQLRAQDPDGARSRVQRLRDARACGESGSEHDIHFSHALFAELHELGDHDGAWQALERGARAKRARLRYDPDDDRRLFGAIQAACDRRFIEGPGHDGGDAPAPVFIVGLFRSGTTLMERMLGGHAQVAEGGESMGFAASLRLAADHRGRGVVDAGILERLDGIDWPALGADFIASSSWRARGRARWTEKMPSNFLALGLIARALPGARFVHMRREPMDVCFANLRMLYGGLCPYSYDQHELAAYHQQYLRLMTHWRDLLGDRVLDVDLTDLTTNPERESRRVLAHCGLGYEAGVLAVQERTGAVSTASAAQVRDGIRAPGPPAWWPYRQQLQPLADALA